MADSEIDIAVTTCLLSAVVGLVAGFVFVLWISADLRTTLLTKDEVQRECIAGNDRACKIYEVDYGN